MKKLIIFGASGDLAKRKIFPALNKLSKLASLRIYPSFSNFDISKIQIFAYARSNLKDCFAKELHKYHEYNSDFPERIKYIRGNYDELEPLASILDENTICYLSVPPSIYPILIEKINRIGCKIIGLEKPFAENYETFKTFRNLNFEKLLFIDHYFVNPLLLTLPKIFQKKIFKVINNKYIRLVFCVFNEEILVEGREYFNKYGLIRDVIENHLFICLLSIIKCILKKDEEIENKSIKRSIIANKFSIINEESIYGQYNGYNDEFKENSNTETYAMIRMECFLDNFKNVPFLLSGGKGLKKKATYISFILREKFYKEIIQLLEINNNILKNIKSIELIFSFTPISEIFLLINKIHKIILISSESISEMMREIYGDKKGYEIIFDSLMNGENIYTGSYDEILVYLKIFNKQNKNIKKIFKYEKGVNLPKEAKEFINNIKNKYN